MRAAQNLLAKKQRPLFLFSRNLSTKSSEIEPLIIDKESSKFLQDSLKKVFDKRSQFPASHLIKIVHENIEKDILDEFKEKFQKQKFCLIKPEINLLDEINPQFLNLISAVLSHELESSVSHNITATTYGQRVVVPHSDFNEEGDIEKIPNILSLCAIKTDGEKSLTKIFDLDFILESLSNKEKEILCKNYFSSNYTQAKFSYPILFKEEDGSYKICFSSNYILSDKFCALATLDEKYEAEIALKSLRDLTLRMRGHKEFPSLILQNGDCLLIDNHRMLHGREYDNKKSNSGSESDSERLYRKLAVSGFVENAKEKGIEPIFYGEHFKGKPPKTEISNPKIEKVAKEIGGLNLS